MTRGEYPAIRGAYAGVSIGVACLAQPAFQAQVAGIREAGRRWHQLTAADEAAARYALRGSRNHQVMWNILLAASDAPAEQAELALHLMWVALPRISDRVKHNRPGRASIARWQRGARLIARRGAGLCLVSNCDRPPDRTIYSGPRTGVEAARRHYCAKHSDPDENKPDAKIIEQTFAAAAAALPTMRDLTVMQALAETEAKKAPAPAGAFFSAGSRPIVTDPHKR